MNIEVGTIGFYRPDPGWGKSPCIVVDNIGALSVYVLPGKLVLEFDPADFMTVDELKDDINKLIIGPQEDWTAEKIKSRVSVLCDAVNYLQNREQVVMKALRAAKEALTNVPSVGDKYDQQHSDTHMRASLGIDAAIDVVPPDGAESTPAAARRPRP